jgi:hypothetical protein
MLSSSASGSPPVTLLNKRRAWPAQLSILAQHHRAVNSVAFSPTGTLLASGSEDRSVRLWDPLTGEQKAILFAHHGQVSPRPPARPPAGSHAPRAPAAAAARLPRLHRPACSGDGGTVPPSVAAHAELGAV